MDTVDLHSLLYNNYSFDAQNPFVNSENPVQTALESIHLGQLPQAILCLEAALQKTPNYSLVNLLFMELEVYILNISRWGSEEMIFGILLIFRHGTCWACVKQKMKMM